MAVNNLRRMSNELNKPLDPAFIDLCACPACDDRPPLHLDADASHLVCDRCGRAYPVQPDGIVLLVTDRAVPADTTSVDTED